MFRAKKIPNKVYTLRETLLGNLESLCHADISSGSDLDQLWDIWTASAQPEWLDTILEFVLDPPPELMKGDSIDVTVEQALARVGGKNPALFINRMCELIPARSNARLALLGSMEEFIVQELKLWSEEACSGRGGNQHLVNMESTFRCVEPLLSGLTGYTEDEVVQLVRVLITLGNSIVFRNRSQTMLETVRDQSAPEWSELQTELSVHLNPPSRQVVQEILDKLALTQTPTNGLSAQESLLGPNWSVEDALQYYADYEPEWIVERVSPLIDRLETRPLAIKILCYVLIRGHRLSQLERAAGLRGQQRQQAMESAVVALSSVMNQLYELSWAEISEMIRGLGYARTPDSIALMRQIRDSVSELYTHLVSQVNTFVSPGDK